MSALSDKLRICYPEFEDTAAPVDATIDVFITKAADQLEALVWAALFEDGSLALAAHLLAMAARSRAAADSGGIAPVGPVTQLRTADEAIAFGAVGVANAKMADKALMQTQYGLEFLRLREMVSGTPLAIC